MEERGHKAIDEAIQRLKMSPRHHEHADFDYDEVLDRVGQFGRYQRFLFLLLWIPSATPAMAVFMYEFTAYEPEHRCFVQGCDASNATFEADFTEFAIPEGDQCNVYNHTGTGCGYPDFDPSLSSKCNQWVYDQSLFPSTAVTDLNMVCANKWKKSMAQSLYMGGMLVGSFVFGALSDHLGRRTTLMITTIVLSLGGTVSALTPAQDDWYPMFAMFRFLTGMGHVGTFVMAFMLSLEYTGLKYRTFCGCLIETPFAIGGLIVGGLSWAGIRDWRTLQLVCSVPCLLMLSFWWIIPESPRWLVAKERLSQLEQDTRTTAKWNKKEFPSDLFKAVAEMPVHDRADHKSEPEPEATFLDLFRPFKICIRTINMFYNWLVTTLCYYGLTSIASTLSNDIFLNFSLLIAVEIPSHFFCIFLMDRWGRKPILSFCQILAGVSCIVGGLVNIPWLTIALAILGKFGATASFTIVFVYTAEMFPTIIRNTAVGSASTCARIGGILAPQIAALASVWKPLPLIIMGGSALIGGLLALTNLPETLGEKLPETMEEALNLGKDKRLSCCGKTS